MSLRKCVVLLLFVVVCTAVFHDVFYVVGCCVASRTVMCDHAVSFDRSEGLGDAHSTACLCGLLSKWGREVSEGSISGACVPSRVLSFIVLMDWCVKCVC